MAPALNLQASDFELFGLPEQFAQEASAIDAQWKLLLREAHPDRFAAQGAAAQRVAMQWAVRINEAHKRLKDPLQRAVYLCERWGGAVNAGMNTAMPADFLMQQMQWREDLEEAGDSIDTLDNLLLRTLAARQQRLAQIAACLDDADDQAASDRHQRAVQAAGHVRALMFIERFSSEISQRLAQLDA